MAVAVEVAPVAELSTVAAAGGDGLGLGMGAGFASLHDPRVFNGKARTLYNTFQTLKFRTLNLQPSPLTSDP